MSPEFMNIYVMPGLMMLMHIGVLVGAVLVSVMYLTYAERKVMALCSAVKAPCLLGHLACYSL